MAEGSKVALTAAMPVIGFLVMLFIAYTMAGMSAFKDVSDKITDGAGAAAGFFAVVILLAAVRFL